MTWRRAAATNKLSGSTRCSAVLFPRSSCALPALPSGAGGLPVLLLLTAAAELGGKRMRVCRDAKSEMGIWGKDRERQNARCKSLWRLLSISAIDRKKCELKELHTALHLLFCWCFWCIICSLGTAKRLLSHAYILTYILFYCFEMKKFTLSLHQYFMIYHEVDVPISRVSLIKLVDASIKSAVLGTGIYFWRYPSFEMEKMPEEKAHEWHPRIPFPLLSYFVPCFICSQLQSLSNQNLRTTCSHLYAAEWMMTLTSN